SQDNFRRRVLAAFFLDVPSDRAKLRISQNQTLSKAMWDSRPRLSGGARFDQLLPTPCHPERLARPLSYSETGWAFLPSLANLEHREERFLRNVDAADALHAFFAFLLLFEQLALAGDVAAIAFGQYVLTDRMDGFAGDDLGADRGLNGDLEHLAGDQFAHF